MPGPTVILPVMRIDWTALSLARPPWASWFLAMISSTVCGPAATAAWLFAGSWPAGCAVAGTAMTIAIANAPINGFNIESS